MAAHRSFAEYVKKRFDNNFWAAAESYLEANLDSLGIELKRNPSCRRDGDFRGQGRTRVG